MSSRDEQIDRMAANLKQWSAEIEKYEAEWEKAADAQRAQLEAHLESLRDRYREAEDQMQKIRESTEAAYGDLVQGYERIADEFMKALTKARDRF